MVQGLTASERRVRPQEYVPRFRREPTRRAGRGRVPHDLQWSPAKDRARRCRPRIRQGAGAAHRDALRPIGGAAARRRPPARLCYASTRGKSFTRPASILHFTCYERTHPAAPCASRKSRLQAPRRETQSWGADECSSSAYAGRAGFHLEDYHRPKRADAAHARCWRAGVKGRSHDGAGLVYGTSKWRRAVVPPLS